MKWLIDLVYAIEDNPRAAGILMLIVMAVLAIVHEVAR